MKRGQGLSVNTLVIVALAVLVLVLSVLFYYNFVDSGRTTIGACENMGGTCMQACGEGMMENPLGENCYENNQRCCIGN